MMNKPIALQSISLVINNKTYFENFSASIYPGKHIAIMGMNGAGKSTLLKIIQGILTPSTGTVVIPQETIFGYVPQTVSEYPELSGGQRFNKALSSALSLDPDVLCLDEPTNHLDQHNKRSLIQMLISWYGTLLVVSHDPDVLALDFDEIWHIEHEIITIFSGNYAEYLRKHDAKQSMMKQQREHLQKEKRKLSKSIQEAHKKAAQSKAANRDENDRTLLGAMKESGSRSSGKNLKRLSKAGQSINEELAQLFVHKVIKPRFNLDARKLSSHKAIVAIVEGSCGYVSSVILYDINMQLNATQRIAILGDNGSGKSTFLKALYRDPTIKIQGNWHLPAQNDIGYLDQHYSLLNPSRTVFQTIQDVAPSWNDHEVRKHLNDFLFSTPHEVTNTVKNLSGGEKVRLALAYIAAKSPYLLLLDEITNNIDKQTRTHLIEVLRNYPGAMIFISHDENFLEEVLVHERYEVKNKSIQLKI